MRHYEEFKDIEYKVDEKNPYTARFILDTGDIFYIEPVFHLQLQGFKQRYPERYDEIIAEIIRLAKRNHLVVFEGDEENEVTHVQNAIYLTVQDVCDPLQIFGEDKSRGSDYGD